MLIYSLTGDMLDGVVAVMLNEQANRSLLDNCMISLAVREIFPQAQVNNTHIFINSMSDKYNTISLPEVAKKATIEFDFMLPEDRKYIKPFSFEIDVPEEVINQIDISNVYKVLSESKTLELVSIN